MKLQPSAVDELQAFSFLKDDTFWTVNNRNYLLTWPRQLLVIESLTWWGKKLEQSSFWYEPAWKVALAQPSSAAAERAYSTLMNSFDVQQDLSLQDYTECLLMLIENLRNKFENSSNNCRTIIIATVMRIQEYITQKIWIIHLKPIQR